MAIAAVSAPRTQVTRTLANQGISAYNAATRWDDARTSSGQYLDSIASSGDTATEKTVASVTRKAGCGYMTNQNAAQANVAGLQALAAGVTGPLGMAIAAVGKQALGSANRWDDARTLGQSFLAGVQSNGTPLEQIVASTAASAASKYLTNENAYQPQIAALTSIASGVSGSPETALANVARTMSDKTNRWDDTRQMGYVFLSSIAEHAEDPGKKVIAESALKASGAYLTDEEGARIQMRAYRDLAN